MKRAAYVPTHAAADFSRIGGGAPQRHLEVTVEEDESLAGSRHGGNSARECGVDVPGDDFAAFMAQSHAADRDRRATAWAELQRQQQQDKQHRLSSSTRPSDSAYCSGTSRSSTTGAVDASVSSAGKRPVPLGKRLAEYIKPSTGQ